MISHVPGHLCVADIVGASGLTAKDIYRLAHRKHWRTVKRPGHREVYYNAEDVFDTLNVNGA